MKSNFDNKAKKFCRGSEWRKWDLQVHTPASALCNNFSNDWDKYVKTLFCKAIENEIAVIGITDYFTIDGYKKIKNEYLSDETKLKILFDEEIKLDINFLDRIKEIKLLPNIEFRFKDIIVIGEKHNKIEGHIIFNDELSIDDIENKFLMKVNFVDGMDMSSTDKSPLTRANIEAFGRKMKAVQTDFKESDYIVGLNCLVVDFEEIKTILEKEQATVFSDNYLIIIPEDDITKMNWRSGAHQVRKKYYIKTNGFFSVNEKTRSWGLSEEVKEEFCSYKPCFSCSDAHSLEGLFHFKSDIACWVKADPTFSGLLQTFFQPKDRVFLGDVPLKITKVEQEKFNYIDRIRVEKNVKAKNETTWFNTDLVFNSGLVAIIGNKGSGKSALADIIGYLVNSHNIERASFLTNQRFRKEDKKFANDYQAYILWKDGRKVFKPTLNDTVTEIQTAEYLPQKHIDELCNELNNGFQNEIDSVIFSYIDSSERMESVSLRELLNKKTTDIELQIQSYKNKIEILVKDIIIIEKKLTNRYIKDIKDKLSQQEDRLARHSDGKPTEVIRHSTSSLTDCIDDLNNKLREVEKHIKEKRSELLKINLKKDVLEKFLSSYEFLEKQVKELNNEGDKITSEYSLGEKLEISLSGNINIIKDLLIRFLEQKQSIQNSLDEHIDIEIDELHQFLLVEKRNIEKEIKDMLLGAEKEDINYQKYLADLNIWETTKNNIIGDSTTEGTIEWCNSEVKYVKNKAYEDYQYLQKELLKNIKSIYDLYFKKIEVYKGLYAPIETKLHTVLKENSDRIEFETIIKLNKDFNTIFLSFIRQNVDSIYKGRTEGNAEIEKIVRECNFQTWEGFELFFKRIQASISEEKDRIEKLLTNIEACYNFIAKLEYLNVVFSLKMDNKTLDELSPGQRGNVLLVFYLALSKRSEPIIIDQPEDNLDNQSVYNKLVPCILEAKKNRQVIIVTHNPNIAVACDAEQIICADINKTTNEITYSSGSIENSTIRKNVIDILEGTMPAFELRRIKYLSH